MKNRFCLLILIAVTRSLVVAQLQTEVPPVVPGAKPVTVEHIKVHGKSLEGNLESNAVDRDVFLLLPPSYAKEKSRRYPVVYALHGFSIGAEQWTTKFMCRDLVAYIDANYRTIPDRTSRGLVGHSMGGYGATRIGMKHAEVFGALYFMSPCCLSPRLAGPP